MITFLIGIAILIVGYLTWGKIAERIFKPDNRLTPAINNPDGVDKVPLSEKKNMLIQLLNIAGLGPILGVALGMKFGPIVFLLIPIGNVIGGAIHDYFVGMVSCRNKGSDFSTLIKKFLGKKIGFVFMIVLMIGLILVIANFTNSPAQVINGISTELFSIDGMAVVTIAVICILAYYFISSVFPIDKIIGKIYPFFGAFLVIVTIFIVVFLIPYAPVIPNVPFSIDGILSSFNQHPDGVPIIPALFITIACGILSGFHATQSPIVARTMRTEKSGRRIFYGMMIAEGVIAMIWAAAVSVLFTTIPETMEIGISSYIVVETVFFIFPVVLAVCSLVLVIILGITSGDTTLRVARTTLADALHIRQDKVHARILVTIPLVAISLGLIVSTYLGSNGFDILWSYFSLFNQIIASFALAMATVYLAVKGNKWLITAIPGAFITFICIAYILWINSEKVGGYAMGFGLPLWLSCAIAIPLAILAMAAAVIHGYKLRKKPDFHPEDEPVYPEPSECKQQKNGF